MAEPLTLGGKIAQALKRSEAINWWLDPDDADTIAGVVMDVVGPDRDQRIQAHAADAKAVVDLTAELERLRAEVSKLRTIITESHEWLTAVDIEREPERYVAAYNALMDRVEAAKSVTP